MSESVDSNLPQVAAVVILAAGAGTRMKSRTAKVLHAVGGRSMVSHAVRAASALDPQDLVVVVGHQREQVIAHLEDVAPNATIAVQEQQLGTGDAVRAGLAVLGDLAGEVVVTSGDVPLLTGETLKQLVAAHRQQRNVVTLLTAVVPNPRGYGRIIRDGDVVARIVEQKDGTPEELAIAEINSGTYVFDADVLEAGIASLEASNAAGELYLTDVIAHARQQGGRVGASVLDDYLQTEGVNDRVQLANLNAEFNRRILDTWMRAGVTIVDPPSTWIHDDVDLAQDVTLLPGTQLYGATSVASGARIGPDTTLTDVEVGENAVVVRSHGSLSVIGPEATVGPFAHLRPGTWLGAQGKIGAFVETRNADIGAGSRLPHLTYCGDARIGEGVYVGAGTIFANYDGVSKHDTKVGDHAFIGSDAVLLAPVTIADGAYVAGGSVVTDDVGPGDLAVARARQRNIEGWVARSRPGTAADEAAKTALAAREESE